MLKTRFLQDMRIIETDFEKTGLASKLFADYINRDAKLASFVADFPQIDTIEKASSVDFGDIFNKSIELFKKVWVQGLLMFVILFLMMIAIEILFFFPLSLLGFFSAGADVVIPACA